MSYRKTEKDGYYVYENDGGKTIATANDRVIFKDGFVFRDLAKTGELLPYEDWRLDAKTRAKDLSERLSIDEIAGLMMYSSHQMIPTLSNSPFKATYNGKSFEEANVPDYAMTDGQKTFLSEDNIRPVSYTHLRAHET